MLYNFSLFQFICAFHLLYLGFYDKIMNTNFKEVSKQLIISNGEKKVCLGRN